MGSEALQLVENVGYINDVSEVQGLSLYYLVQFLMPLFITWIFTCLSKTLQKLHVSRSLFVSLLVTYFPQNKEKYNIPQYAVRLKLARSLIGINHLQI
jgi:hypothetical protein